MAVVMPSPWSLSVYRDGHQITDPVPVSDFDAANVLADVIAGWLGGPVSVGRAVVDERKAHDGRLPFDEGLQEPTADWLSATMDWLSATDDPPRPVVDVPLPDTEAS